MGLLFRQVLLAFCVTTSVAYRYDPRYTQYNLNTNQDASGVLEYSGEWTGHQYTTSPDNWRFPFYTLFLDRFVNGDPTNDNINGTHFEHDLNSNQMRHGGDLQGLIDTLDYLAGMGIKGLYIAGSPFINQPWGYDQYSPLDLSILDAHSGTIDMWRQAIDAIHDHGMYVVLDNTFATMGDLIGFDGYLNETTPFKTEEHKVLWKSARQYRDFSIGNTYNETCKYPKFWLETGYPVGSEVTDQMKGCYDSEFDQYGDTEAFGVYPDWRRQLTKFASVQDRLREWHEPTRQKIEHFYCLAIGQLDIDGYRYDKATQSTVEAMGYMNDAMRRCARKYGKENFFLPGEITGGNVFGSLFIGRGRQPDMQPENLTVAVTLSNASDSKYFLREPEYSGLDSGAFHYTTYRTMTRFLGMDGNLEAGYDAPKNWVDQWNSFLLTNDLTNANTGEFDPRHMFGVTNQDVFRWGSIRQGVERQLLGHFITTLTLPGIPLLLWGEEQAFYVLDNTAANYIFGRQPMSAATAWMHHGCYSMDPPSTQYYEMPVDAALNGCNDPIQMHDRRDPTHPVRNILRHMYHLRDNYPVLNDGMFLQQLSNQSEDVQLPGSSDTPTEFGLWSVMRSQFPGVQDLSTAGGQGDVSIWLLYSNRNETTNYEFDCSNNDTGRATTALIAPYDAGTTVKNLFYPYDELTLIEGAHKLGINGSTNANGCLNSLKMEPYSYHAYVPKANWVSPKPMLTKFTPGHDARIESSVGPSGVEDVDVELQFSAQMDCESVTNSISFSSTSYSGKSPSIASDSISCNIIDAANTSSYIGGVPSTWLWKATLTGVENGVHGITVRNPVSESGVATNATEHLVFRIGQIINPVIFPLLANYSSSLLTKKDGKLTIHHVATGANQWRYSTNWGSSFSDWMPYEGGNNTIEEQSWSGTKLQAWDGVHVKVEYFNRLTGSSDIVQQGDLEADQSMRRFPHLFWNGPYNQYGYDAGLDNKLRHTGNNTWELHFMSEWRMSGVLAQVNVWGINPDGKPDQSFVMGDIDGDAVLDRLPPSSLADIVLNITDFPPKPYLGWKFVLDDGNLKFRIIPSGSMWPQVILYVLLWTVPIITAAIAVWLFMQSFYQVKFNEIGIAEKASFIPLAVRRVFRGGYKDLGHDEEDTEKPHFLSMLRHKSNTFMRSTGALVNTEKRRTVLIATMEYDIEDWAIKIKIGGLGVMAQLMGKNLGHQDLIWVVPCVSGVDYPEDTKAEPMTVVIMGITYEVQVQYHVLRNITYVLLDAPVFRQQTKSEPYPARMDDMTSAIYYSAWNQCIAQAINRFPIDLYHINDYHGSIAPLYLLPRTVPACLSLHNAEFQGLWPMRTKKEQDEVCAVFNLPVPIAQRYVQFGEVFNLLHAGASYLREHQQGFGAVGVSKKYGKRAYARYPIFWGLKKVGKLPNPDPSDTGEWNKKLPKESEITVDAEFEAKRGELRRQAQEWAGLNQDPDAELCVFVGRWSMQKGIDLIADVFPSILESNPKVQLITIGPVIDLYGKFAAAKLDKMMKVYPGRVFSKPEFTALPPFIFSGAEFALIPSRDEPFGLVAVEFGRKGALGIGARVGGLGQMPGFWYTVEATTTSHLIHQFKTALFEALALKKETRAIMRARSAKQRFPVAQWVEDLEILQGTAMRIHDKVEASKRHSEAQDLWGVNRFTPAVMTPAEAMTPVGAQTPALVKNRSSASLAGLQDKLIQLKAQSEGGRLRKRNSSAIYASVSGAATPSGSGLKRQASLGSRRGPGHVRSNGQNPPRISVMSPVSDAEEHPEEIGVAIAAEHEPSSSSEESDGASVFDDDGLRDGNLTGKNARIMAPEQSHSRSSGSRAFSGLGSAVTNDPANDLVSPRLSTFNSGIDSPTSPGHLTPSVAAEGLLLPKPAWSDKKENRLSASPSVLSIDTVVGSKTDFNLQKVDPFFTDSNGDFYRDFERKLDGLSGSNSDKTCVEEFLVKSEKKWFDSFRDAKLGRYSYARSARSSFEAPRPEPGLSHRQSSTFEGSHGSHWDEGSGSTAYEGFNDEFLLGKDYKPPTGLRKWMQLRVGDWPVYSFFLGFGQIIAANSYQITLLTGEVGQTAEKLYVIASIYLVTSLLWWLMYRRMASIYCLSIPFVFYGLAFLFIGLAHFSSSGNGRGWVQNIGTAWYAVASSSGSIFFALNFGDEGGAQTKAWVFRACVIQGTQQIYVVALWAWGAYLSRRNMDGLLASNPVSNSWRITAICLPIAVMFWIVGAVMFLGLPTYYRQHPGKMPSFYSSIYRRKIVMWFFVTVIIQNFFLSAPYGRNWSFLWSSEVAKWWQILLLVLFFFIGVWAAFLGVFAWLSKSHNWILPLFAIGLGAPRWAQIWWGTSNIGLYLPWANGPLASALASRSLWLWLGTLDAIQGVGLGMILLATLTRVHVAFTLIMAQVLGSIATILARACAPNKIGPGPISPDISKGTGEIFTAWFWIGLVMNLSCCVGFFMFYRKEQLSKP